MYVLNYLKNHSLARLQHEFAIKVKEYPEHELAVLNYNQLDSPKYHPIVRECRGLIINPKTLKIVSRTFPRFFNLNEWVDDPFDYNGIEWIEEKADGSLMHLYWYNGNWNLASRGTAFGESPTPAGPTLREIFELAVGKNIQDFAKPLTPGITYVFELCSIFNKVVKLYDKPTAYLTGMFSSYEEFSHFYLNSVAAELNVKRPTVYSDVNIDNIHDTFKNFAPTDEGYVLVDVYGNRIKVKNPTYVDLHHLKGNGEITPKRIADVVFRGETDEVLSYFPEFGEFFLPYQNAYDRFIKEVHDVWERTKGIENRKEFAMEVKDLPYSSILFSMKNDLTFEDAVSKLSSNAKVAILENLR